MKNQGNRTSQPYAARLRRLHAHMQCNWSRVAEHLGISESMIYQVLKGATGFSEKVLLRLERWEKEFGCGQEKEATPPRGNVRIEKISAPWREVPVVSWATAGAAKDYSDLANFLDEKVVTECKDPNAFAVIVDGDSMEPKISAGDRVVVTPNTAAQSGDLVIARTRKDHAVYFKRFLRFGPSGRKVRLMSYNPEYPALEFKLSDFAFIYPVVNLVRIFRRP